MKTIEQLNIPFSPKDVSYHLTKALFTRIRMIIIPFYPKKVSSDRNSIHTYLDRLPILFTRSRIRLLSGQTLCGWALRSHISFLILPGQAVHTCLGLENCSPDRFVLHFQRRINILRIEKGKLSGQGRKGVSARSIRIEFTRIGIVSGYVWTEPKCHQISAASASYSRSSRWKTGGSSPPPPPPRVR